MLRLVHFRRLRHLLHLGAADVESFLTHSPIRGSVAAATQNQTLSALLFWVPVGALAATIANFSHPSQSGAW